MITDETLGDVAIDYVVLADKIQDIFMHQASYTMNRHTPVFEVNSQYAGDAYMTTIFEPRGEQPPLFYHTFSPYDAISKKAPCRATVYDNGERLMDIDFDPYVMPRTGVMSPVVARSLGWKGLADKKVLFVGTGNAAKCAVQACKALFPDFVGADFVNNGSDAASFIKQAEAIGVNVQRGDLQNFGTYDFVICHTSAKEPVLTATYAAAVKPGALITTFASDNSIDVTKDFFNSDNAAVIVDWAQTVDEAPELHDAITENLCSKDEVNYLGDLFSGTTKLQSAKYMMYRSHGTPMQNLAVLQLLLKKGKL